MIDGIDRVRWWFWSANLGGGTSCGSGDVLVGRCQSSLRFGQDCSESIDSRVFTLGFKKSALRVEEPPKSRVLSWRGSRV